MPVGMPGAMAVAMGWSIESSGDWEYRRQMLRAEITRYRGNDTDVVVPTQFHQRGWGWIDTVIGINSGAFSQSRNLRSVTIPNNVSVNAGSFNDAPSITRIIVDTNNPEYSSVDGVLFNKDRTTLIRVPEGKSGRYTVPSSVRTIGGSAFRNCRNLTSVTIGSNVTTIDFNAFSGCTRLTSVTIPNSVTTIGGGAFSGCTRLESVTIGRNVTSIGARAFSGCTSEQ